MFYSFKVCKKYFVYFFTFVILFCSNAVMAYSNDVFVMATPKDKFCVVLDAGHGGIDGGCLGSLGIYERDINLSISQKVGNFLDNLGVSVVYTRTNEDGLYGTFASGFKMRDMKERQRIIEQANPNLVVSIHLNSFPSGSARGAQVFYALDSEISQELGQELQDLFLENIEGSRKECKPGDFYILNCTDTPGILVECGFLSNAEEEKLLVSNEYQEKIAYTIACGIIAYFGLEQ